jgi:hypothetical protein
VDEKDFAFTDVAGGQKNNPPRGFNWVVRLATMCGEGSWRLVGTLPVAAEREIRRGLLLHPAVMFPVGTAAGRSGGTEYTRPGREGVRRQQQSQDRNGSQTSQANRTLKNLSLIPGRVYNVTSPCDASSGSARLAGTLQLEKQIMPGGGTPLGLAYFAGVKLLGYTGYSGLVIQRHIEPPPQSAALAWKAGFVRTLIGIAVGTIVGFGFWPIVKYASGAERLGVPLFFTLLLPIRILEWNLFLYWVYRSDRFPGMARWKLIAGGVIVSFVLDFIGVVAMFAIPGGAWIC